MSRGLGSCFSFSILCLRKKENNPQLRGHSGFLLARKGTLIPAQIPVVPGKLWHVRTRELLNFFFFFTAFSLKSNEDLLALACSPVGFYLLG